MTALLLAAALGANLCAERFWDRDLGGLVRLLADTSASHGECDRLFFSELADLVDCRPLAPLAELVRQSPERVLLRVEEARRVRLASQPTPSPTLWRDLIDPEFFRRDTLPPGMQGDLLVWPVETERWPNERIKPAEPRSRCGSAHSSATEELDLLGPELLDALARRAQDDRSWAEPLSRAAYHRAVLLLRAGDEEAARAAAEQIDADQLVGPLGAFAGLLRASLGVAPASSFAELATDERLGEARSLAVLLAAQHAMQEERWEDLLALTPAPHDGPAANHLALLHAVALARLKRTDALFAFLEQRFARPPVRSDAALDALRALGLEELATAGLADGRDALLAKLAHGTNRPRTLSRFALRALALNQADSARIAAGQLASSRNAADRARGLALQVELAAATRDAHSFDEAIASLLDASPAGFSRPREREPRDRVALELGHALLTRIAAAPPDWRARLRRYLSALRPVLHERHHAALAELERSARAPTTAALIPLGEVRVESSPAPLPPAPRLVVHWPEPYSLLAIPDAEGRLRAWFEAEGGSELNASTERTR